MRLPTLTGLFVLLAAGCAHAPAQGEVALARWNENHPAAARTLCGWASTHPAAAHVLFDWSGNHPARSHAFLAWTFTHPLQPVETFLALHPGWGRFRQLTETHRPGTEAFMRWVRNHPRAAEDLASHPRGLSFAGHHLSC